MVSRRFMPPDSGSTRSSARSAQLRELEQLVGLAAGRGPRDVEVAGVDDEVLPQRELLVQAVLLRHDAQAGADAGPVDRRVEAEHPQRAGRDGRHAADHPHGGGLPGTVRPEEAEGLALAHLEVDAVDGGERAEPLGQALGPDEGRPPAAAGSVPPSTPGRLRADRPGPPGVCRAARPEARRTVAPVRWQPWPASACSPRRARRPGTGRDVVDGATVDDVLTAAVAALRRRGSRPSCRRAGSGSTASRPSRRPPWATPTRSRPPPVSGGCRWP